MKKAWKKMTPKKAPTNRGKKETTEQFIKRRNEEKTKGR